MLSYRDVDVGGGPRLTIRCPECISHQPTVPILTLNKDFVIKEAEEFCPDAEPIDTTMELTRAPFPGEHAVREAKARATAERAASRRASAEKAKPNGDPLAHDEGDAMAVGTSGTSDADDYQVLLKKYARLM